MAARSRARRAGAVVVLGAVVMLVLGRGLGLWSTDAGGAGADPGVDAAAPQSPRSASQSVAAALPATGLPATGSTTTGSTAAGSTAAGVSSVGPAPQLPGSMPAEPSPVSPRPAAEIASAPHQADVGNDADEAATRAAADDRAAARRSLVQGALAEQRIAAAFCALDRFADGGDGGYGATATLRGEAERALAAGCDQLARELATGEFLAAEARLERLLRPEHRVSAAAVRALCAARGWPGLTAATAATAAPSSGGDAADRPTLRERAVRLRGSDGAVLRARVVAESDAGVTVRAVGADGVTFPTVPSWTVEPEAVTPLEAAQLGFAALDAGDRARAALWCACGLARGGPQPVRLTQLLAALR